MITLISRQDYEENKIHLRKDIIHEFKNNEWLWFLLIGPQSSDTRNIEDIASKFNSQDYCETEEEIIYSIYYDKLPSQDD